jgi:CheY-like chemotaxis protein
VETTMKKTLQVSCDHQRAWVRSWAAHALFLLAAFTVSGAHAQLFSLEEPRYQSLQKDAAFELRLYNPMIVAEVVVQGDLAAASSLKAGMNDYLSKPFKIDELADTLAAWLTQERPKPL